MSRRFIEQVILTLLFAVLSTFVLTMVSFLDFGSQSDMNYNEFFSPNTMKVSVITSGKSGDFEVDFYNLGENYTVTRNVSMTTDYEKDSIRAVYSKGEYQIPTIYDGRYFTQEEFDSEAAVCVVGKLVAERALKEGEDGKKYFSHYGVDYEVIGYIGVSKATDLDNMVMLNMKRFNKDMHYFTTYYIDANDKETVEAVKNNFVAEFNDEVAAEACRVSVYEREHTSVLDMGEATYLFMIAFGMIIINGVLSIYQFIDKRAYSAAVKKLCGFSMVGVIFELMVNFFVMTTIGFVAGAAIKDPIFSKIINMIDGAVEVPEGYEGAWIAYIVVMVFTLAVALITSTRIYLRDTSGYLKAKD